MTSLYFAGAQIRPTTLLARYVAQVDALPIFPLNAVIFPGSVIPLHVFEERYQELLHDVSSQERPEDRVFGTVAIREGYEIGDKGMQSLHRIGVLVRLSHQEQRADGSWDIEVVARQRISILQTDQSGPYLRAEVALIDETAGDPDITRLNTVAAQSAFSDYRRVLSSIGDSLGLNSSMPQEPVELSYSLGAASVLTMPQNQQVLECQDAAQRLGYISDLLREECRIIQALPSLPATELSRTRWSPN